MDAQLRGRLPHGEPAEGAQAGRGIGLELAVDATWKQKCDGTLGPYAPIGVAAVGAGTAGVERTKHHLLLIDDDVGRSVVLWVTTRCAQVFTVVCVEQHADAKTRRQNDLMFIVERKERAQFGLDAYVAQCAK